MRRSFLLATAVGAAALGSTAFVVTQEAETPAAPAETAAPASSSTVQPIAFPHNTHAGQFNMDCQYCHFSAERSLDAGIPPVATCWGCHQIIQGRNKPEEVAKIREYWEAGEPIPWVRIYKVSDHVQFPHMRHVNAGVDCTECHGQVQEIEVIEEVAPVAKNLGMGWCISCHVENEVRRDCTVCHY
jgi:hypothetical protein